ncbi:CPBP family intramembrane glutamic endopeptidase [Candidatus Eisenbacteria bacterium]|uniref:CPBP family intramembrane glutamic endopeptidase n=1 Tax=Eiseniibacteriota bacterium TaxID=2212470 RepID=A0ABV6YN98_UNCEI
MNKWITGHQLISYFILAFGISWGIWIPVILFLVKDGGWHPLLFAGVFGLFAAAIIVTWISEGGSGLRKWLRRSFNVKINPAWYVLSWIVLPVAVGAFHFLLYYVFGGKPDFTGAEPWIKFVISVPIAALIAGGNEEPGWRGYALPKLTGRMSPLKASLLLGLIWSAWHIPLFTLQGWGGPEKHIGLFTVSVVGLSIVMTWLFYRSRMSVIPVMLFHQATNNISDAFPMPTDLIAGVDDWQILRGITYWVFAIILLIATKGRLGYHESGTGSGRT